MANDRTDDRDAEVDPVTEKVRLIELPEDPLYIERAPIAAVSVSTGDPRRESLHVVCSDGACFRHQRDGEWHELEPVPGTERAAMQGEPSGTYDEKADMKEATPDD